MNIPCVVALSVVFSAVAGRLFDGKNLTNEHPRKYESPLSLRASLAVGRELLSNLVNPRVASLPKPVKQKINALGLCLAPCNRGGDHAIFAS